MRVRIRFYAELNDFLPPERRFRTLETEPVISRSVKDLIESYGIPHTEVDLILVNGQSVDFAYAVEDGDRISVYPVFESFDIRPVLRVRPEPLRETRFVLDIHLGRLAGWLRLLGFDTLYRNDYRDDELARISRDERRILLTRDVGLLKRATVTHGYFVRETAVRNQLREVARRFDLRGSVQPFSRCKECNSLLEPVPKEQIAATLPPRTLDLYDEYRRCPGCGRIYWKGGHYRRMLALVDEALTGRP